ncbi:CCDC39 [Scenedesmus sp. PABB004]|nr:CCDC39 [Scenedesmus sp. PABB004]
MTEPAPEGGGPLARPADAPDDGEPEASFLPPFANADNRALDAHIRALERQLAQVDAALEENGGRIGVMDEHLKNVQQEITYTESRVGARAAAAPRRARVRALADPPSCLDAPRRARCAAPRALRQVEAEKREAETEQHLKIMADKEIARMRTDLERLGRERGELAERVAGLQAGIFRGSERLDQFKERMSWNQEELEQWAVAQRQKEEDNAALEKYRRQDEGKLKDLGLAVEKLTTRVAAAKDALDAEITDTQAAQTQLDRTAQDFRALHAERQELIRQWDEAREAMRHRDEAIQARAAPGRRAAAAAGGRARQRLPGPRRRPTAPAGGARPSPRCAGAGGGVCGAQGAAEAEAGGAGRAGARPGRCARAAAGRCWLGSARGDPGGAAPSDAAGPPCAPAGEGARNRELEAQISQYERELGKARDAQAAEAARLDAAASQVEVLQSTLAKAANDLADAGTGNAAARRALEEKRARLEGVRKKHAALKAQLEGEAGQLGSLESKARGALGATRRPGRGPRRASAALRPASHAPAPRRLPQVSQLEALRRRDEAGLRALQGEHEALRREALRAGASLHALRVREKELVSEIAGGQGQARNLGARMRALDEQLLRQGELMYAEMERRIARAGGRRSDDEARALNARIAQLTEVLAGVNAEHAMLLGQVKQAETDLGEARRASGALGAEQRRVGDAIDRLRLETDSAARALKAAIGDKERQLVEHDVLKLQVHRLRQLLSMAADEVYSLESRKVQLKLSLDERRHEIEVHRDGLRAELKLVRDDIHRVTLELRDREARAEALGAKFEALAGRGRGADPDGGEPRSQAYYIIKAAQEREGLQVAGDALDAKITQSEAEVAMLHSTLAQMQATNVAFNSSLRAGDTKATQQEKAALRCAGWGLEQLDASYDRLKALRAQEAALLAEAAAAAAAGSSSDDELAAMTAAVADLARRKAEAERQLDEQREREARAAKALARAQKLVATQAAMAAAQGGDAGGGDGSGSARGRSSGGAGGAAAPLDAQEVQREVQLAEARGVTRTMLQELRALAVAHPARAVGRGGLAAHRLAGSAGSAPSRANPRTDLAGSPSAFSCAPGRAFASISDLLWRRSDQAGATPATQRPSCSAAGPGAAAGPSGVDLMRSALAGIDAEHALVSRAAEAWGIPAEVLTSHVQALARLMGPAGFDTPAHALWMMVRAPQLRDCGEAALRGAARRLSALAADAGLDRGALLSAAYRRPWMLAAMQAPAPPAGGAPGWRRELASLLLEVEALGGGGASAAPAGASPAAPARAVRAYLAFAEAAAAVSGGARAVAAAVAPAVRSTPAPRARDGGSGGGGRGGGGGDACVAVAPDLQQLLGACPPLVACPQQRWHALLAGLRCTARPDGPAAAAQLLACNPYLLAGHTAADGAWHDYDGGVGGTAAEPPVRAFAWV